MRRSWRISAAVCAIVSVGAVAHAESYSYDALGRIVLVVSDNGNQTQYAYDASGNRTSVATTVGSAQAPLPQDITITASAAPATTSILPLSGTTGLSLIGASAPLYGAISVSGSTIIYTRPVSSLSNTDVLTYTVQNSSGLTGSATIRVNL